MSGPLVTSLGFFGDIISQHAFLDDGSPLPQRRAWVFDTAVFDVTDDPDLEALVFTLASSSPASTFVQSLHDDPGSLLTNADATILLAAGAWRQLQINTLTANHALTLGTGGGEVHGSQIAITIDNQLQFTYAVLNGGAGGGTLYTFPPNFKGTAIFQYNGTAWILRYAPANYGNASGTMAGLLSSTLFSNLTGLVAGTPVAPDFAPSGLTGATATSRYAGGTAGGAPTSGTFTTGDYIEDQLGGFWCCIAGGSPGTWLYIPAIQGLNKITTAGQTLKASPAGTLNELSASGTGAVLPAAVSANIGSIAVAKFNNLASYAIGRTGSDTIDGATSFTPSSGTAPYQIASFYVSAAGVWLSL